MKREILEIIVAMPYDFENSMKMPKDFTIEYQPKNSVFSVNLEVLKTSSICISGYVTSNPDSRTYKIDSDQISSEDVLLFLQFSYGKKIAINYQTHDQIKKIATYFNSPLLLDKSYEFLKYVNTIETVLRMVRDQKYSEKCLRFIAQHFYVFRISQLLKNLDMNFIYQILLMPNLCDDSEESICLFLMERLSQIKEDQVAFINVNELLSSIRSELFHDSFCQYLIKNFGSQKKYLLPLIQRRLTYEKENDPLFYRIYQKNNIEICMEQFFQDYSNIT